ncbi:MAG: DUF4292 domain-containing protein [Bdellovibrio sp.]|nr:DUF4292 domain-containing protein [Bdellovibrio sp.]
MKIKMISLIQFSGLLFLTLGLAACGTNSVKEIPAGVSVLLQTKAQIKSKDQKNNVNIEIALAPGKAIRMEVTGTLGYRVATVVMTPQNIQYALHTSQSYYQGPFSAKSLYPIFNQYIDPRILWKAIHDQNPQSTNLSCQVDSSERPIACKGPQELTVKWTYQEPPQKKIELKNNQFEMIWLFKERTLLTTSQSETFVLKKPSGYKEIILK